MRPEEHKHEDEGPIKEASPPSPHTCRRLRSDYNEAILEKWREDLREIGRRYGESLRQAEESVRAALGGKPGIRA